MFCLFISIQFRDKIVLIVIYELLNVQYPLWLVRGTSDDSIESNIRCDQWYIGWFDDDLISIQYPLWPFNGKYIGWFD